MSILGLYEWDSQLLDPMVLPDGIDHDVLIPDLLAQLAEYEVLYSDPEVIKTVVESWSRHRLPVWQRIVNASVKSYDPIENYNRREEWTDTGTGSGTASGSADQLAAGYNPVASLVKQGQTDTSSNTSTSTHNTHTGWMHGNIGVTSSQQMLEQELALAPKLDPYQYIITDFKRRFCVLLF